METVTEQSNQVSTPAQNAGALAALITGNQSIGNAVEKNRAGQQGQQNQPATQQTQAPVVQPVVQTQQQPVSPVAPVTPPAASADSAQEQFIDTPLGKVRVTPAATTSAPVVNSFDEAFKTKEVENTFGRQFASPIEFLTEGVAIVKDARAKAAKAGQIEAELNGLKASLSALPQEARDFFSSVVDGVVSGDDSWKSMLATTPSITFTAPVDKVDKKTLINHFYPGKFNEESFSDPANDQNINLVYDAAKGLYTAKQQQIQMTAKNKVLEAQREKERVSASVDQSIAAITKFLPVQPDEARINEVREMMLNGTWRNSLVNDDGTYSETAAAAILMQKHGPQTFGEVVKFIENRTTTAMNEKYVDQGGQVQVNGNGTQVVDEKKQRDEENKKSLASLFTGSGNYSLTNRQP